MKSLKNILPICSLIFFLHISTCDGGFFFDNLSNIMAKGSLEGLMTTWQNFMNSSEALKLNAVLNVRLVRSIPILLKKWFKERNNRRITLFFAGLFNEIKDIIIYRKTDLHVDDKDVVFHFKYPEIDGEVSLIEIAARKGKVFFIIHGWYEDVKDTHWYEKLTENLAKVYPDCTVVQVDWGHYANKNIYILAAINTRKIGNLIAARLMEMVNKYGASVNNIILIGFSLGAQVSGQIGKRFNELSNQTLPKIIALDPAGPLFEGIQDDNRLDKSDADHVIAIHTDTDMCGYKGPCGTIDFYPNGGFEQPGCKYEQLFCNHWRAPLLFAEAILSPENYPTEKCDKYKDFQEGICEKSDILFGDISNKAEGVFYFTTTSKPPFYNNWPSLKSIFG